jgi:hypothetical protein
LEAAEIELDRRVIAREELVEALADCAAEPRSRRWRARWCRPGGTGCR